HADLADDPGSYPRVPDPAGEVVDDLSRDLVLGSLGQPGRVERTDVPAATHDHVHAALLGDGAQRDRITAQADRGGFHDGAAACRGERRELVGRDVDLVKAQVVGVP